MGLQPLPLPTSYHLLLTTYPILSEAGVRRQGGLGHTNVGQEGKLELQPRVGTGVVEEADILGLEERQYQARLTSLAWKKGDIKPGPGPSQESQVLPSCRANLKGLPGWPDDPSTVRAQERTKGPGYWHAFHLALEHSFSALLSM